MSGAKKNACEFVRITYVTKICSMINSCFGERENENKIKFITNDKGPLVRAFKLYFSNTGVNFFFVFHS
jgi:hypothetical protein